MPELTEAQKRKRDEIAESLKADPEFQPQAGRTKEESAFAVATERVQTMEKPNPKGNPMDPTIRQTIMEEAAALRTSGDADLEAKGLILQVATAREDLPAIRKTLADLSKEARRLGVESNAEAWDYLRKAIEGGESE